jgi:hypothetical protein
VNILQACDDPNLFAPWFRDPTTWSAWRSFLGALFALPMTSEQLTVYNACTGRTEPPTQPATEAWLAVGRRGGKSLVMGLLAVYLACFRSYTQYLQPGERGTVLVIAADRRQARTIMRYVRGMLTRIPMLARVIERETAESFDLVNDVSIEIGTASFRSTRGYTVVAACCDEVAFWQTDDSSSDPDYEILDALRPGMATIPNALLICASSPYAKKGALHDAYRRYYGRPGPILVWKAPTRVMNPSVPQRLIDEAMERDQAAANSEWMAEFRADISSFVPREIVLRCVDSGEVERPFVFKHRYAAFVDPSGGSSDSFTLAIAHRLNEQIIVDLVREIVAPFDPESATEEFSNLLRGYHLNHVTGDRYAGEWVRQSFQKRNITHTLSELPKSGLYTNLLPKLNSQTIRLVDNARLVNQLAALERRTSRGGKDSIDHPPHGKDDVANVVAGVANVVTDQKGSWGIRRLPWM